MAWQEITVIRKQRRPLAAVAYGYGLKYGARIVVPGNVCASLGWTAGMRLRLFEGADEHAGKLRLAPDRDGPLKAQRTTGAPLWVLIGKLPQLVDRTLTLMSIDHEVDGSALVVTLPASALVSTKPRVEPVKQVEKRRAEAAVPAAPTSPRPSAADRFAPTPVDRRMYGDLADDVALLRLAGGQDVSRFKDQFRIGNDVVSAEELRARASKLRSRRGLPPARGSSESAAP